MANELVHKTQGTSLTQAEYENVDAHICNSQATGDIIYASSTTQLTRLGIGTTDQFLKVAGGIPAWATPDIDDLRTFIESGNVIYLPTNAGWTNQESAGSGAGAQQIMRQYVNTGATASSKYTLTAMIAGMAKTFAYNQGIDWDRKITLLLNYDRDTSESQSISRIQIGAGTTNAILAAKGIGLQVDNLALTGESYGAARSTVNLSTTLTSAQWYQIKIVHTPATSVEFFVNGVSAGSITTTANIPSGQVSSIHYLLHSIMNGVTGGTDAYSFISNIWIIQN